MEHVSSPVKTRRCSILNSRSTSLDGDICDSDSATEKSFFFSNFKHHEQYPKFQSTFQNDVLKLKKTFQDLENPFVEDSGQ